MIYFDAQGELMHVGCRPKTKVPSTPSGLVAVGLRFAFGSPSRPGIFAVPDGSPSTPTSWLNACHLLLPRRLKTAAPGCTGP